MNVVAHREARARAYFATRRRAGSCLCGWLLVTGLFWIMIVQSYVDAEPATGLQPVHGERAEPHATTCSVPFFGNCAVVLIMVAPALSMRLFSEEVKQRTLELLLTSPVSTVEIVLGKFLGRARVRRR